MQLDEICKNENILTILDIVECSTVVIVQDVRNFTNNDAIKIAQKFNYSNDIEDEDIDEDFASPIAEKSIKKFVIDKDDVKKVLSKISETYVNLVTNKSTPNGYKNTKFIKKNTLTRDDIDAIAKQLSIGDYSYSFQSRNVHFPGVILHVFITNKDFILPDGRKLENLSIYIKIDSTSEGIVTAVSFHEGKGTSTGNPYVEI